MNDTRIVRYTYVLLFLVLSFLILHYLKFYLVPAMVAALLAMLMLPFNTWMEKWKVPRVIAVIISLLIILFAFSLIVYLFYTQVRKLADDLPFIRDQLRIKYEAFERSMSRELNIDRESIGAQIDLFFSNLGKFTKGLLMATGGTLAGLGLVIVHFIFFLIYRERIKRFLMKLIPSAEHERAEDVIARITGVTQKYLTGVVTVMIVLGILNSLGLLMLGITNAIFFGVLAAILNIIPYVGVWIGSLLPVALALITKDEWWYAAATLGVFLVTQFIDNNFLTPKITGSHVQINPLATIAAIIMGNLTWGIMGMILFIPLFAILKIVFDSVNELKPFGYLIGDDTEHEQSHIIRAIKKVRRRKSEQK